MNIVEWGLNFNIKTISNSIKCGPIHDFQTSTRTGKDFERRKMNSVRVDEKTLAKFCLAYRKITIFFNRWWKVDVFQQSNMQKILGRPWSAFNITSRAQYAWKEAFFSLCIWGDNSELWIKNCWNLAKRLLVIDTDTIDKNLTTH